jgi:hypothetical protein
MLSSILWFNLILVLYVFFNTHQRHNRRHDSDHIRRQNEHTKSVLQQFEIHQLQSDYGISTPGPELSTFSPIISEPIPARTLSRNSTRKRKYNLHNATSSRTTIVIGNFYYYQDNQTGEIFPQTEEARQHMSVYFPGYLAPTSMSRLSVVNSLPAVSSMISPADAFNYECLEFSLDGPTDDDDVCIFNVCTMPCGFLHFLLPSFYDTFFHFFNTTDKLQCSKQIFYVIFLFKTIYLYYISGSSIWCLHSNGYYYCYGFEFE